MDLKPWKRAEAQRPTRFHAEGQWNRAESKILVRYQAGQWNWAGGLALRVHSDEPWKRDGGQLAIRKPALQQAAPNQIVCQEAYFNHAFGLIGRWPPRQHPFSNEPLDNWMYTKSLGKLNFPIIMEDTTSTTCVRIGFAFVKAIFLYLKPRKGEELIVNHYDKGQPCTCVFRNEEHPSQFPWASALAALELNPWVDLPFIADEPRWGVFGMAFILFLRRGNRRVYIEHVMFAILNTAIICQIRATLEKKNGPDGQGWCTPQTKAARALSKITTEEARQVVKSANALDETTDPYDQGAFQAFELTLILAQEFAACTQSFPRVNLSDYFDLRLVMKLYDTPVRDVLLQNLRTRAYTNQVWKNFSGLVKKEFIKMGTGRGYELKMAQPRQTRQPCVLNSIMNGFLVS